MHAMLMVSFIDKGGYIRGVGTGQFVQAMA